MGKFEFALTNPEEKKTFEYNHLDVDIKEAAETLKGYLKELDASKEDVWNALYSKFSDDLIYIYMNLWPQLRERKGIHDEYLVEQMKKSFEYLAQTTIESIKIDLAQIDLVSRNLSSDDMKKYKGDFEAIGKMIIRPLTEFGLNKSITELEAMIAILDKKLSLIAPSGR